MGFLSKAKLDKARATNKNDLKSILIPASGRPVRVPPPPMDLDRIMRGPGLNPRAERTIEGIPISQLPFNPRMPRKPFPRKPKIRRDKKRGGLFGLRNFFRRLKEQRGGDMGMPRKAMPIGPGVRLQMPTGLGDRMIGTPQPISERMPVSNAPSFNPTIFGQPIGDMDFSQMPKISPEDMLNLQVPTEMPMTQDLPEVAPVGMMPQMRMDNMQDMEPRMMMQEGEDVSLERELFSLQAQLKNLEEQLRLDRSYNDDQAVIDTSAKMAAMQKRIQEIMEGRPQLKDGGDFPDLTGDGKVTQADILKGRGVYAEGDEVMMTEEFEMMAPSGDEIEASLMEVQDIQPEMQALDQYVQMVIEMVQAGASEAEVIESLRQAGLDDDDIEALFQAVMETLQSNMEQGGIDAELAQLS